jgi:hypothetical protein
METLHLLATANCQLFFQLENFSTFPFTPHRTKVDGRALQRQNLKRMPQKNWLKMG